MEALNRWPIASSQELVSAAICAVFSLTGVVPLIVPMQTRASNKPGNAPTALTS